jgi:beta-galactosidase/beta-glucuronidase
MQLRREQWICLNGAWDFALDPRAEFAGPEHVAFDRTITVPFSPETPASGVYETGFFDTVWYRRSFDRPEIAPGQRLILHFGAVDYEATVWINDHVACQHEGGYVPFSIDITDLLQDGQNTIIVRAFDDPQDLTKPRGKQDWQLEPHSIWYYRTSGIWQTVWMEIVPETRIGSLRWTPRVDQWEIDLRVKLIGPTEPGMRLRVRLELNAKPLVEDVYSLSDREVIRAIGLPDPGIDDYRNELLWAPNHPTLIDAQVDLIDPDGQVIDSVLSYTAMRAVATDSTSFLLNGRMLRLAMVLDQGYWRESGLTAPSDDALRKDVELVKSMGFNGVRKHQKIEDPRFLYWADKLGLLVWEEMPSPYRFAPETVDRLTRQWLSAMERDVSHPCIVAWVPFNESWGVPDLPEVADQRQFLRGVFHLTKAFDPTRPVIGNDGWEMVKTDILAIHDYERVPDTIRARYARGNGNLDHLFQYERPGHRQLLLDGHPIEGHPIMLTEFGGIAYHKDVKHTWGYKRAGTQAEFRKQYTDLLAAVRAVDTFAGFCYTQFTDTYQEANGLLYMDRTPKFPIEQIRQATSG